MEIAIVVVLVALGISSLISARLLEAQRLRRLDNLAQGFALYYKDLAKQSTNPIKIGVVEPASLVPASSHVYSIRVFEVEPGRVDGRA